MNKRENEKKTSKNKKLRQDSHLMLGNSFSDILDISREFFDVRKHSEKVKGELDEKTLEY